MKNDIDNRWERLQRLTEFLEELRLRTYTNLLISEFYIYLISSSKGTNVGSGYKSLRQYIFI